MKEKKREKLKWNVKLRKKNKKERRENNKKKKQEKFLILTQDG